jgi:serine/threonine protein kinase
MPLQQLPVQNALVGGKYRLGEIIGSGGVGTVYRATHLWTERQVAVKVLEPSLPHFELLRDAFLREARAAVQLDHPNVVDVLDMGEDDAHTTYLVMELLDGPTLREVLLEQGRLSAQDMFSILLPLIEALEKAHELGIVHRDFKPENIILSVDALEGSTPKLLDFGVAQVLREPRSRGLASRDDVVIGTPQYMSPEQARDDRALVGPHTDVWGVGIVWYECLTGHPPFDGEAALDVLTAVCEAPIDFSEIPDAHVPILRDALHRSIEGRIQSLLELRARIEDAGLVTPPDPGRRTSGSSWPSPAKRPSYIRRTLRGVGPSEQVGTDARPAQLDSELLSLPLTSHRKALAGGIALAFAIGLAVWWTMGGLEPEPKASGEPARLEAPSPEIQESPSEMRPAPNIRSEDRVTGGESESGASAEEPEPATPSSQPAAPSQAMAASEPAPPKAKPAAPGEARTTELKRPSSTPSPSYEKPPDLVTEW